MTDPEDKQDTRFDDLKARIAALNVRLLSGTITPEEKDTLARLQAEAVRLTGPGPGRAWGSIYGESVIQTGTVSDPDRTPFVGFKITDESKCQMLTLSPPPPNPFDTHGTIYSNGTTSEYQYGEKFDSLATVSEGRTRLIINLETLRKNPKCIQLTIELLYASLRP